MFRPAAKLATFQLAVSRRWGFFSFFVCNLTARMELGIIPVKKNYFFPNKSEVRTKIFSCA